MAMQEAATRIPLSGADFAPGQALPAPPQPETVVTVRPSEAEEGHSIQIFSSVHERLGSTARTYAQALHTEVYLENDLIEPSDLDELGIYADEYSDRSTYLYVKNGSKVAAARYIHADKKEGLLSLPTAKHFEVDPENLRAVAGVRRLADIKPQEVVEISGLVARKQHGGAEGSLDATIALYARMLRDSLEGGHKVWILNIEKGFLRYLNGMVGREEVHVLGPEKEYMGPPTVPVAINPQSVVKSALLATGFGSDMKRAYLKEVLAGVDDRKIPADIRSLLRQHDIPTTEYSPTKRLLTNPKTMAYTAIMGYSAARALPAGTVEEFQGNTAVLWGIDVATAVPYAWGVIESFTGKSLPRRAAGAVIGAASFIAPYAYFSMEGNDYPGYVQAAVGGFVGAAVIKEALTQGLKSRKERSIHAGLTTSGLRSIDKSARTAPTEDMRTDTSSPGKAPKLSAVPHVA